MMLSFGCATTVPPFFDLAWIPGLIRVFSGSLLKIFPTIFFPMLEKVLLQQLFFFPDKGGAHRFFLSSCNNIRSPLEDHLGNFTSYLQPIPLSGLWARSHPPPFCLESVVPLRQPDPPSAHFPFSLWPVRLIRCPFGTFSAIRTLTV